MKPRIGIIGGAGFIGQNFTHYFLKRNYAVNIISRKIDARVIKHNHVKTFEIDIKDTKNLLKSIDGCDVAIWLVSSLVPSIHNESLVDDFQQNTNPLVKFLEKAKDIPRLKKFVYLSSGGTIYGDSINNEPLDENSHKRPISAYGLSKIVAENYIKFLTSQSKIESFILRPSNVYGKYQNLFKPQGIIGHAFRSIIKNESIDLYDEGKVTRDFIYVSDLAAAVSKCLESEQKEGITAVYNVGSQEGYTIKEILEKIVFISGMEIKTVPKSSREFDCNYNVLQIKKIDNDLGWHPTIGIDEGLKKVWTWINDVKNGL